MTTHQHADFYITAEADMLPLACRILDKAYQNKHQVYVHMQNAMDMQKLNELLWTFQQSSFIPHALITQMQDDPRPPIQLGDDKLLASNPIQHRDIFFNLSMAKPPSIALECNRIIEIVFNHEQSQKILEKNKLFYQDNKFDIKEYDLRIKTT